MLAAGQRDAVLGAVPAEHLALGVEVVDVAADPDDRVREAGEEPEVDAAVVVAVDDHDVRVKQSSGRVAQQRVGKPL